MESRRRSVFIPALLAGGILVLAFCLVVPFVPCSLCRREQVVVVVDQVKGVQIGDCPCCGSRGRMTLVNGLRSKLARDDPGRWR